jgi:multidrug efflux system membrane fusion protein
LFGNRFVAIGAAVVVALVLIAVSTRWLGTRESANALAPSGGRVVSVELAPAVRKQMPVVLEALGTVTPIRSVAVKSRIDNEILDVHFADGAVVKTGDLLLSLDPRATEAQIRQVEGNVAKDQAQLEGAERDVRRYTELVAKSATPILNLENAKTAADSFRAALKSDNGALENLKVQLSYCTVRAPISGRISQANVKVGNFVRSADTVPIAVINQIAPIYVSFTVPQRSLPDVRQALAAETASVEAVIPGDPRRASGQVTMIENAVDAATGMATVRATMPNTDELLWPGSLVTVKLTLRSEEAVAIPSVAVQVSQTGTFVFVVKNGVATVQPVKVGRTMGDRAIIESGLNGGESVVTDGHLLLTDGTRVTPRERKAGV